MIEAGICLAAGGFSVTDSHFSAEAMEDGVESLSRGKLSLRLTQLSSRKEWVLNALQGT